MSCVDQSVRAWIEPKGRAKKVTKDGEVLLRLIAIDCALPAEGASIRVATTVDGVVKDCSEPAGCVELFDDGDEKAHGDGVAHDGIYSVLWKPSTPAIYELALPSPSWTGDNAITTIEVVENQQ